MQYLQFLLLVLSSSPASAAPAALYQEPYPGISGGDPTLPIQDSPTVGNPDPNDVQRPAFASSNAASAMTVAKKDVTVSETTIDPTTAGMTMDKRDFIPRAPYPWESDPTYHGEQLWINVFPDGTIQRPGENVSVHPGRRSFS